jgi:chromosomal replication initiator protein
MLYGGRTKRLADLRHIAMWVCRDYLVASYPEIGKAFGGMDHSSVIHGVRRVDKTPSLREQAEKVIATIQGGRS